MTPRDFVYRALNSRSMNCAVSIQSIAVEFLFFQTVYSLEPWSVTLENHLNLYRRKMRERTKKRIFEGCSYDVMRLSGSLAGIADPTKDDRPRISRWISIRNQRASRLTHWVITVLSIEINIVRITPNDFNIKRLKWHAFMKNSQKS